nr:Na/Pi cotransporter family protein [uncultured Desulfobacter sp.]
MKQPYQCFPIRTLLNPIFSVLVLGILFGGTAIAVTADSPSASIDWLSMAKGLFGGLALFLFGMDQISKALKSALGNQMKVLLGKLTRTRLTAVLTGTFITAVVQSSSVTTVLVVGFVSAGMMTMAQSVGVIMGANIGSTITAQIVAFKVEEAALWMIAGGFLTMFIARQERIKHYGNMLMGLGLIFFGMGLMGESMHPLRSYPPFLHLIAQMGNPFLAILVGAGFTALVQSSSATTAIVITMAGQGFISLETGIALAFGANIGTCVTALLATLGKPREAIRAAVVHVIFNVAGVLIWLPFISILAGWVLSISPTHAQLEGTARLAAEVPRQIANAHTLFNIVNTLIFISFTTQIARLAKWLVPDRPEQEKAAMKPAFINDSLIKTPTLALESVRLELSHLADLIAQMLGGIANTMLARDKDKLADVMEKGALVNALGDQILRYLALIRKQELTSEEVFDLTLAMRAVDQFANVGNVVGTEMVSMCRTALDEQVRLSETMRHLLNEIRNKIESSLAITTRAIRELDRDAAQAVLDMKADVDRLFDQAIELQSHALSATDGDIRITRLELSLFNQLKRIDSHLRRIARSVADPRHTGEQTQAKTQVRTGTDS